MKRNWEYSPNFDREWQEVTPMRRVATPEDYIGPLVFLASDASAFVTGKRSSTSMEDGRSRGIIQPWRVTTLRANGIAAQEERNGTGIVRRSAPRSYLGGGA